MLYVHLRRICNFKSSMCMDIHVHEHATTYSGGQRTILCSWFTPSIFMWVLEIELLEPGMNLTFWSSCLHLQSAEISYSPLGTAWFVFETGSPAIAQDGLELPVILLPQPRECWDYRCELPALAKESFFLAYIKCPEQKASS